MTKFIGVVSILFFSGFANASLQYKCTYFLNNPESTFKFDPLIEETFNFASPESPFARDTKQEFEFSGRTIRFDFWQHSRPNVPDTIAVSIDNGGVGSQEMQFAFPAYKIEWHSSSKYGQTMESIYCYDENTYK
jgi:hypothetical protein